MSTGLVPQNHDRLGIGRDCEVGLVTERQRDSALSEFGGKVEGRDHIPLSVSARVEGLIIANKYVI